MNIFENLIEDLKEENLLEETVIHISKADNPATTELAPIAQSTETQSADVQNQTDTEQQTPPINEAEFYRKRAMDEVAFLQIVEHVFAGVEREQLKIVPKPYDDLKVKKVLHNLLQLAPDVDPMERSKAESQLMQETESWHWSLAQRDERLTAAHLRRYCETSRPALSSPALVALARFYRNSPYSEPVRNKFDLVVTRLFSRDNGGSQREMVFSRAELATHLTELYAEWSSVPMYSTNAENPEISEIVRKFESYIEYADEAVDFDDLIKSDFFKRVHLFKEGMNENFYAPIVTATGIESNIRIGNRYVELLEAEKQNGNGASFENSYGITRDKEISEATAKTYSLLEMLNQKKPAPRVEEKHKRETAAAKEKVKSQANKKSEENKSSKPNKWLIAATILAVLITAGIYFATKPSSSVARNASSGAKTNAGNPSLKEYVQEARVENGKLIGSVSAMWNQMPEEARKEALKTMLSFGSEKGYKKVQLENKSGKTIGYADEASVLVMD